MDHATSGDRLSCEAITKAGPRCKLRARPGMATCSRHAPAPEDDVVTPMATTTERRGPDDDALYAAFAARNVQRADLARPVPPPPARAAGGGKGSLLAVAIVLAILWAVGRAGGDAVEVPAAYGGGEAWTKPYSSTTCGDWRAVMTAGQQRTYVSDNLVGLRERNGGATPLPSPRQVDGMLSEVVAGCAGGLSPHESIVVAFFAGGRAYTS